MLFKVVDDWKQNLHPDDEVRLNGILRRIQQHRAAYRSSKDVKTAQLWCALLELDKKNQAIVADFAKLEMIISGFADVIRRAESNGSCDCSSQKEYSRSDCSQSKKNECCCECEEEKYPSRSHSHRDAKLIESLEKF